jgi:predicted ATPase with chaperone activity
LGNGGVLLLDELTEFGTRMLEILRQPLDPTGKVISISPAVGSLTYSGDSFIEPLRLLNVGAFFLPTPQ